MKISVLVPVYNVARHIERCLASILSQTLQDFEVILVDDGSSDKSIDLAKRFVLGDERFNFYQNSCNMGLMQTRKVAYQLAKGDYIVFLDSDDALTLTALEVLYESISNSKADIVVANHKYIPVRGDYILSNNQVIGRGDKVNVYRSLLSNKLAHSLWAKIYKRELLQNYSYITYDKFVNSEDVMLFYQLVDNSCEVIAIEDVVYDYYQNMESSTNVKISRHAVECIILSQKLRIDLSKKYTELDAEFNVFVIDVLTSLVLKGYDKKFIKEIAFKNNMANLYSYRHINKYFSNLKSLMFWAVLNHYPFSLK